MTKNFEAATYFRRGEIVDPVVEPHIRFLKKNYRTIGATALIVGLLASVYAFVELPVYRASILLQVQEPFESTSRSSLEDVSSLFATKPRAATEMEKLTSRGILEAAIAPMHLDISLTPKRNILERVRDRFVTAWRRVTDGGDQTETRQTKASVAELPAKLQRKKLDVVSEGNGRYRLVLPGGVESFEGTVSTLETFNSRYGTIQLKIDSLAGEPGQTFVLRRLSRSSIIDDLQDTIGVNERGKESNIVSVSLEGIDPTFVRDVLHAVGTTYVSNETDRKNSDAQKSIEALRTELPSLKSQIEQSEDRYNQFRNRTGAVNLNEQGNVVIKQLAEVQAKITDLQVQREELLRRFTKDDGTVLAVNRQLSTLSARAEELEAQARTLPEVEQQAQRLSRDINVNNQLYAGLLANMQQLRFIKAGRVDEVRLIDDAELPEKPVKPRRVLIVLLSVLFGAFLGTLIALARKMWSGRIDGPDDIERQTGLPVLASGAFGALLGDPLTGRVSGAGKGGALALVSQTKAPSGESLRRFSAIVQYQMQQAGSRIAIFTGVSEQAETSLITERVAALLAQSGARVLLVDANVRQGTLTLKRNAGSASGLLDIVSGRGTFERGVRPGGEGDFDFLPRGLYSNGALASFLRGTLQQSLASICERYEYVIVDSSPVLKAGETLALARHAGCVFAVARSMSSTLSDLDACVEALEAVGARVTGALLDTTAYKKTGSTSDESASAAAAATGRAGGAPLARRREALAEGMVRRPSDAA
jgi:tyrosine-protein kinase Etk/Wzc